MVGDTDSYRIKTIIQKWYPTIYKKLQLGLFELRYFNLRRKNRKTILKVKIVLITRIVPNAKQNQSPRPFGTYTFFIT